MLIQAAGATGAFILRMPVSSILTVKQTPRKVIFLDVDGVLHAVSGRRGYFQRDCLLRLRRVVEVTGAQIVLSSNWRRSRANRQSVYRALRSYDLRVYDITPVLEGTIASVRVQEIFEWIRLNHFQGHWIVIDDIDLASCSGSLLERKFVKTNPAVGLDANSEALCTALLGDRNANRGNTRAHPVGLISAEMNPFKLIPFGASRRYAPAVA